MYKIHPIVVGTKVFDKSMMTYQYGAGQAAITGFCVINENFNPPAPIKAMEMDVIPPGTPVNVYESYDIMLKVKDMAEILLPLHEPEFASIDTIS